MDDPIERAKSESSGLGKLIGNLPGIKGYREKEQRRDADKRVRDTVARRLETRRRKLTALQADLLSGGGLAWMDDVERVVGRLQLLIDRVKTASYGYAPIWGMARVKEEDLDRLILFDERLLDEVARLDEAVAKLEAAVQSSDGIKDALKEIGDLLVSLNETFSRRTDVIQNATA